MKLAGIALTALALSALPGAAETVHSWGVSPSSSATLAPGTGIVVAMVLCVNRLTNGHDSLLVFSLDLHGFTVEVTVDHGDHTYPDIFAVTPPEGYIAVPPSVSVEEGETAVILIFAADGAGA